LNPNGFLFDLTVSIDGQDQPSVQAVQVVVSNFEFRPVPSAGADVVQAGPHAFSILGRGCGRWETAKRQHADQHTTSDELSYPRSCHLHSARLCVEETYVNSKLLINRKSVR
jgi:hypothetical protein